MGKYLPLDFHDDPRRAGAELTKTASESFRSIRQATVPTRAELDALPANRFALVLRSSEGDVKRFPCFDKASTALSVAAFNTNMGHMPSSMVKVAGFHLSQAAELYGTQRPASSGPRVVSNVVLGTRPELKKKASSLEEAVRGARWFNNYAETLSDPRERREIARRLVEELEGTPVPPFGKVAQYGGTGFGPDFRALVSQRRQLALQDDHRDRYEAVASMADWLGPDKTAAALYELDRESGVSNQWNKGVPDPYLTVFAGSVGPMEKAASEGSSLVDRAREHEDELKETFGARFYTDLLNQPDVVVAALPKPEREAFESIVGA